MRKLNIAKSKIYSNYLLRVLLVYRTLQFSFVYRSLMLYFSKEYVKISPNLDNQLNNKNFKNEV